MFVLQQLGNGSLYAPKVRPAGYRFLEQHFEKYGPQALTHEATFPSDGCY